MYQYVCRYMYMYMYMYVYMYVHNSCSNYSLNEVFGYSTLYEYSQLLRPTRDYVASQGHGVPGGQYGTSGSGSTCTHM